jgi:hypothetical protein
VTHGFFQVAEIKSGFRGTFVDGCHES